MEDQASELLAQWRAGDERAANQLFGRYADRLVALVRSRLPKQLAHRIDSEDVVQSVYRSFFATTREGRYDLQRGGDLWRLLVAMTLNKLYDQVKRNRAHKRDADRERTFGSEDSLLGIQGDLLTRAPSPLEAATLAEQLEQVMSRLEPLQRRVLELRLQGYNLEEIAADMNCSQRTVRRLLEVVKQQLAQWQGTPEG